MASPDPPAPPPEADHWIEEAAGRCDPGLLGRLMDAYGSRLAGFLRRVGSLNEHDAEDAAQETWAKANRFLPNFKAGSFQALLFRIARNEAENVRRRGGRASAAGDLTERAAPLVGEPDLDDEAASERELLRHCERLLRAAKPLIFAAYEARHEVDYSEVPYVRVAESLKIPEKTARTRVFKAMSHLKKCVRKSRGRR